MAVAPFIKPIATRKGIFYTFQSSLEDLTLTFNNSGNQFKFSKFVLLNLPNVGNTNSTILPTDNKILFKAQGESLIIDPLIYNQSNQNINLAQSFQNYALNLETLLISQATYNRELPLNTSERVFWKWLKELGAVRWRAANSLETTSTTKFTEEGEAVGSAYSKVVKYIGEIDIVNSYKGNENAFTELYLHIPNNVGTTPYALFNSVSDDNYYPNMVITNKPALPQDREVIAGRHYNDSHPAGLSINAFYDQDNGSVDVYQAELNSATYTPGVWYNNGSLGLNNSYYTDAYYNSSADSWEFNHSINKKVRKIFVSNTGTTTINYTRNQLDGVCLDFNLNSYLLATQNSQTSFAGFSDINVNNRDFDFNAVLVYYDVIDPVTSTIKATNLYGVLFLNKIETEGLEFAVPRLKKYRPDPLTKINGNSYAFKLNVKFDTSIEEVAVEPVKNINANAGFSLELFVDVLNKLQDISSKQDAKYIELVALQQEWTSAKNALLTTQSSAELINRVSAVEKALLANSALFTNTASVINKITNVETQLEDFVTGKTSTEVAYNTDVIKQGRGIGINRSIPNQVIISNEAVDYNFETTPVFDITTSPTIKLVPYMNYYRHEHNGTAYQLTNNLTLKIDDTLYPWKKGQVLRLVFADPINALGYTITLKTDALARADNRDFSSITEAYNTEVKDNSSGSILTDYEWSDSDSFQRPIFEIICVDPLTLQFKIDRIK